MSQPDPKKLINAKKNVKILILGSYTKGKKLALRKDSLMELEKLRNYLKMKGFEQTKLVKDWDQEEKPDEGMPNAYFKQKSFFYIDKWAEIFVFVFLPKVNNISVTREWSYLIDKNNSRCRQCVILRHQSINLGSLIKGDLEEEHVFEYSFKNIEELKSFAYGACFNIVYNLLNTT